MNDDIAMIMLPKARIAFAHLEKPHAPPNSNDLKYSCDFLLDNNDPAHVQAWNDAWAAITQLANEKWGEMSTAILQQIDSDPKLRGFGAGNNRVNKKDMQVLQGYAGMMYITAKSSNPPNLIGADGRAIDPTNAVQKSKKPYAGCYVNGLVKIWLQDNQYGRGIRFDLIAVQFAADGESFGAVHVDADTAASYFRSIPGAPAPVAQAPGQVPQPGAAPTSGGNGGFGGFGGQGPITPPWQ